MVAENLNASRAKMASPTLTFNTGSLPTKQTRIANAAAGHASARVWCVIGKTTPVIDERMYHSRSHIALPPAK